MYLLYVAIHPCDIVVTTYILFILWVTFSMLQFHNDFLSCLNTAAQYIFSGGTILGQNAHNQNEHLQKRKSYSCRCHHPIGEQQQITRLHLL